MAPIDAGPASVIHLMKTAEITGNPPYSILPYSIGVTRRLAVRRLGEPAATADAERAWRFVIGGMWEWLSSFAGWKSGLGIAQNCRDVDVDAAYPRQHAAAEAQFPPGERFTNVSAGDHLDSSRRAAAR